MSSIIDTILRLSGKGPIKYIIKWPILAALIIKNKIDAHYYTLLSDVGKREEIVRWGQSYGCKIIVETGTYMGRTTEYVSRYFDRCITIELDATLYKSALDKF